MITLSMQRMARAPSMWMVMLWGMRLPSTTSLPSHATKPRASTPSNARRVVRKSRDKAAAKRRSNAGRPAKAPRQRLMNSIQVCAALKVA